MRFFSAFLLLLLVSAAPVPAAEQKPAVPAIAVPALDDAALEQWNSKIQIYVKALNGMQNPRTVFSSYMAWAKEKGPTGKETSPGGISDVAPYMKSLETAAEQSDKISLKIPLMDLALHELAAAAKEVAPVASEANGYYRRKDYLEDGMAKGKELHPKIVAVFTRLFDAADRLSAMLRQVNPKVQKQALAQVERKYGKKYYWQHKNVMIAAGDLVDVTPTSTGAPLDKPAFDTALKQFLAAVKGFEDYYNATGEEAVRKEVQMGFAPGSFDSFIGYARELAANADHGDKSAAHKYGNALKSFIHSYNSLVDSSNHARFYMEKK